MGSTGLHNKVPGMMSSQDFSIGAGPNGQQPPKEHSFGGGGHEDGSNDIAKQNAQHYAATELSVGPSVFDQANLGSMIDPQGSIAKPGVIGTTDKKREQLNSSMVIHDEELDGAHPELGKPHEVPKTQGKKSLNSMVKQSLARADSQTFDDGVHLNHGAIGGAFGGHRVGASLS